MVVVFFIVGKEEEMRKRYQDYYEVEVAREVGLNAAAVATFHPRGQVGLHHWPREPFLVSSVGPFYVMIVQFFFNHV